MIVTGGFGLGGQGYVPTSGFGRGSYTQIIQPPEQILFSSSYGRRKEYRKEPPVEFREDDDILALLIKWVLENEEMP